MSFPKYDKFLSLLYLRRFPSGWWNTSWVTPASLKCSLNSSPTTPPLSNTFNHSQKITGSSTSSRRLMKICWISNSYSRKITKERSQPSEYQTVSFHSVTQPTMILKRNIRMNFRKSETMPTSAICIFPFMHLSSLS